MLRNAGVNFYSGRYFSIDNTNFNVNQCQHETRRHDAPRYQPHQKSKIRAPLSIVGSLSLIVIPYS